MRTPVIPTPYQNKRGERFLLLAIITWGEGIDSWAEVEVADESGPYTISMEGFLANWSLVAPAVLIQKAC